MITLISPYSDVTSLGPRTISAYLRKAGHKTRLLFLPYLVSEVEYKADFIFRYDEKLLKQISEVSADSDLIGISLMTNYYYHAIDLTRRLKKDHPKIPLAWGGIHPTLAPDECIEHADLVCIGEAELAVEELMQRLADKRSLDDLANFWVRDADGTVHRNDPRDLIPDLDTLPDPDYDATEQYVRDPKSGDLVPFTDERLMALLTHDTATKHRSRCFYQTVTSRGCPWVCSFCCWSALNPMYKGDANFRRRSPRAVVDEVKRMRKRLPFIDSITFSDDQFLAATIPYLREFRDIYKAEVGLPFQCLAGPTTISEERMDIAVEAGLRNIQIGVQSFSQRTMTEVYDRPVANEKVIKCAEILNRYKDRIAPPIYDFILDNPWETDEDLIETLRFVVELPRPYHLQIFSLVFFPGTEIYKKAKAEGKLPPHQERVYVSQYNDRRITYLNLIFSMASHNWPRPLLRTLLNPLFLKTAGRPLLNDVYKKVYELYRMLVLLPMRLRPKPRYAQLGM